MAIKSLPAIMLTLLAVPGLSGCATYSSKKSAYFANTPEIKVSEVKQFKSDQDDLIREFAGLGGLSDVPTDGEGWRMVVDGGMTYIDMRCSRFMDALFWLNRARETSSHQVQFVGAAASAVMAIVDASRKLIGISPLGFSLADQTINNIGQGLLYHLDPGIVAGLVRKQQGTYRNAIKGVAYTNRAAAVSAISGYAELCLPVNIEGEVNRSIEASEYQRVDYRPAHNVADGTGTQAGSEDSEAPPPPPPPPPPPAQSPEENLVPQLEQRRPD